MDVRPMGPADRPAVEALCRECFGRLYAYFALRGLDRAETLVALLAAGPVGFVEVQPILGERVANVYFVGVTAAARGRGVGRALLAAALARAEARGLRYALASVPRGNEASLRLFGGAGFRPESFGSLRRAFGLRGAMAVYQEARVAPHERVLGLDLGSPRKGGKGY